MSLTSIVAAQLARRPRTMAIARPPHRSAMEMWNRQEHSPLHSPDYDGAIYSLTS